MGAASSVTLANQQSVRAGRPKVNPTVANSLANNENNTTIILGRLTEIRILKLSHEGIVVMRVMELP